MSLTKQEIITLIKTYTRVNSISSLRILNPQNITAWGSISGDINSQTDLQTLFANKISFDDLYYDADLKALIYLESES